MIGRSASSFSWDPAIREGRTSSAAFSPAAYMYVNDTPAGK
jgi:hypothetical protein